MIQKICFIVLIFIGFQMKAQSDLPKISSDDIIVEKYSHADIVTSFGIRNKSVTKAKFFKHPNKSKSNSVIKTVIVNTRSQVDGAKMKLHFYNVNFDGSPGTEITKPLVFTCKKGRNDTAIDVEFNGISIPENGIFIGFEWLIIDENSIHSNETILGKNVSTESVLEGRKSEMVLKYSPSIGVIPLRKSNIWDFKDGEWISSSKDNKKYILGSNLNPFYNKYYGLAISLILTK